MLTVPFTRGSMMMLRFSICPIAASAATANRGRVRLAANIRARLRRRPCSAAIQPDTLGHTVTDDQHVIGMHLFQNHAGRDRLARREAAQTLVADGDERTARRENAEQANRRAIGPHRCEPFVAP